MRYDEMTGREQRLSRQAICPLCGEQISKLDDVQVVKIKYGKQMIYSYFHSACIINSLLISSQLEEGIENEKAK